MKNNLSVVLFLVVLLMSLMNLTVAPSATVNPNFGYATVGEYEVSCMDQVIGSKFTATANMTVDTIYAYIFASITKVVRTAIYDVDDDTLLIQSNEVTVYASSGAWEEFTLPYQTGLISGTEYCFCVWSDNAQDIRIAADDGDAGQTLQLSLNYNEEEGEFPSDLTGFGSTALVCSIYAPYAAPPVEKYSTWVQALDAGGTGLIIQTNVTVTLDNGTSYQDSTYIVEMPHPETWMASFSLPAGTHSVRVEWEEHVIAETTINVTGDATHYVTTSLIRLESGEYYLPTLPWHWHLSKIPPHFLLLGGGAISIIMLSMLWKKRKAK